MPGEPPTRVVNVVNCSAIPVNVVASPLPAERRALSVSAVGRRWWKQMRNLRWAEREADRLFFDSPVSSGQPVLVLPEVFGPGATR
jgi:hypothetical protein